MLDPLSPLWHNCDNPVRKQVGKPSVNSEILRLVTLESMVRLRSAAGIMPLSAIGFFPFFSCEISVVWYFPSLLISLDPILC